MIDPEIPMTVAEWRSLAYLAEKASDACDDAGDDTNAHRYAILADKANARATGLQQGRVIP